MKKIIPLMALILLASACDSPRSQRAIISSNQSSNGLNNGVNLGSGTTTTNTGTTPGATTGTTTPSNVPEDAKHCKFSTDGINGFESNSTHLGSYTLCQSSSDKSVFYAQVKTPPVGASGDVSICFIPHTTSGSNSIYIGNPMCGSFTNPKEVKKITFVKYSQYSNALINSVLFFKDTSYYYPVFNRNMMTLDAYKTCMNMLAYGQTAYCEAFKSVAQYVIKTF